MTTTETDLAGWLLACIAEDEAAARDCGGAPWVDQVPSMVHVDPAAIRDAKWQFGRMGYVASVEHDHDRAHITRWDPARVLAECAAKRRTIARYLHVKAFIPDLQAEAVLYDTLKEMAQPFSERPGFLAVWSL